MPRSMINHITDQIIIYDNLRKDALSRKDMIRYQEYTDLVNELKAKLRLPIFLYYHIVKNNYL